MIWGFLAYGALALLALRFAWREPTRLIAAAALANVVLSNLVGAALPPDAQPGINCIGEMLIYIAALLSVFSARPEAISIMVLNFAQVMLAFSQSVSASAAIPYYEIWANAILVAELAIINRRAVLDGLGYIFGRGGVLRAPIDLLGLGSRCAEGLVSGRQEVLGEPEDTR